MTRKVTLIAVLVFLGGCGGGGDAHKSNCHRPTDNYVAALMGYCGGGFSA